MNLNIFCLFIISTAFATATTLSLFSHQPAKAGENYEEEIDSFDDTREASYDGVVGAECRLTEALKGELHSCTFVHSTKSTEDYPSITFYKRSDKGWDFCNCGSHKTACRGDGMMIFSSSEPVKVILTFSSGVTRRRSLPANSFAMTTDSGVLESLDVILTSIKNELKNLTKLEVQYGSANSLWIWINDRPLTSKAMDFVDSGSNASKGKSYADSIEDTLFR